MNELESAKMELIKKGYALKYENTEGIVFTKDVRRHWLWWIILLGIPFTAALISLPVFIAWIFWKREDVKVVYKNESN
jgi:hypothetical protein